jgi:hypothetical protein
VTTPISSDQFTAILTELAAIRAELQELRAARPANDNGGTWLNAKAIGALLDMTPVAVRAAARRGSLPVHYLGRRLRFLRAEVLARLKGRGKR